VAQIMALFNVQKEMVLGGKSNIVTDKNLFNTAGELIKLIDLKTVEPYFTDPESEEGQRAAQAAQKPDPEVMKLQMQGQLKSQEMGQKADIEKTQAIADIETNRQKMAADMQAKEREYQLKERLMLLEHELEKERIAREEARKDREHEAKMAAMRDGHFLKMEEGGQKMAMANQSHQQRMAQAESQKGAE
jgi:hypothetical protein